MIAIVDTGGANHMSVTNALLRLGHEAEVTSDSGKIKSASHVILPGVGHAEFAMQKINESALRNTIADLKQPVLGICLGMQLLFSSSEEGDATTLGLLPGKVLKMKSTDDFLVPHMGWNQLSGTGQLLKGIDPDAYFYFVHSFACPDSEFIVAKSRAPRPVPAVLEYRNFFATQFHPERSSIQGAQLLKNFLAIGES